jgi:hypothetical protein
MDSARQQKRAGIRSNSGPPNVRDALMAAPHAAARMPENFVPVPDGHRQVTRYC